jgi:ankyrin repeat protein
MFSELYGQGSLLESFRVLVEDLGCDMNITNTNSRTIFHHQYFGYKVMQVVNELGLSVNWNKRDSEEETFIHSNPRWLRDPRLLIVYLQQSQLSINTRDSRGRSPLHSYCVDLPTLRSDFTFDVRMPLDFGADRHLEDSDGRTVIDVCISALDDRMGRGLFRSKRSEFLDETIKLLASYSTVAIDPRKVDLHYDSEKWLDPIGWHSRYRYP